MTLLDTHLEQISLSSAAIADLPFPTPKIFTNALLHSHDITALIRDTELHERALFSLTSGQRYSDSSREIKNRRGTVRHASGARDLYPENPVLKRGQGPGSAVSTLLGGEFGEQIKKEGLKDGKERGELDVDLLLKGAEKLCGIYPVTGAPERIASLRSRHEQVDSSIAQYEMRVSKQTAQLAKMNRLKEGDGDFDDDNVGPLFDMDENIVNELIPVSKEDLRREDEEIRELEKKKRGLEDRVSGMERDLGGLLR